MAFILYYRLIGDLGPVKALMVTLLIPVFGILWGVLLLGEPVTPGRIAGCAIVLPAARWRWALRLPFAIRGVDLGTRMNTDKSG